MRKGAMLRLMPNLLRRSAGFLLLVFLLFVPIVGRAQQYELPCPSGTGPVQNGTSLDPSTGMYRGFLCRNQTNGMVSFNDLQGVPVLVAANFLTPTADCGAKTAAALESLLGASGIVYWSAGCGPNIATSFTILPGQQVQCVQGQTWNVSAVIYNQGGLGIGMPGAIGGALGGDTGPCILKEANGANLLPGMIVMNGGNGGSVTHLTIDCNGTNNPSEGPGIYASNAPRALFDDVQINSCSAASSAGLYLGPGSVVPKIFDMLFNGNAYGIQCVGTGGVGSMDAFISFSEIDGSGIAGISSTDCTGGRLEHNDLTANTTYGLLLQGTASGALSDGWLVVGNSFANCGEDIALNGTNSGASFETISNNSFFGNACRTDNSIPMISSFSSGGSTYSNNLFLSLASHRATYAIQETGATVASITGPNQYWGPYSVGQALFTQTGLAGTGACASFSTQLGTETLGSFKCTGTSGAATITITPGITAPNGFNCTLQDLTTTADTLLQTGYTTTSCSVSAAAIASADLIKFSAMPF